MKMREILFKAKRIDNGEWVEGYYLKYIKTLSGEIEHRIFISDGDGVTWYAVHGDTICQYTGLTDKNGNKIWENDVVEAWSDGTIACGKVKQRIDGTWIMYPAWQNKTMWYLMPNEFGETTVEVIGTIFDNPELLENE